MPRAAEDLSTAKERLLEATGRVRWLKGVGLGLVDGKPGLIVSVSPGAEEQARQVIDALELDVALKIRSLREVKKRLAK